ncbi:unnamed protein product [Choristocarpus tenellus]
MMLRGTLSNQSFSIKHVRPFSDEESDESGLGVDANGKREGVISDMEIWERRLSETPRNGTTPASLPEHHLRLWKSHGKTGGGGIHVVICCCKETTEELEVMLSTFKKRMRMPYRVHLTLIMDAHTTPEARSMSPTFQALRRLLSLTESNQPAEFDCQMYSGIIEETVIFFDLYVKGPRLARGKRNSLVHFFNNILPVRIEEGKVMEPDAVYLTDADCGHPVRTKLLPENSMRSRNIIGIDFYTFFKILAACGIPSIAVYKEFSPVYLKCIIVSRVSIPPRDESMLCGRKSREEL